MVPVEQADLDELTQQIINLAEALRKEIHERIQLVEHGVEALEKQVATVAVALGEQAAMLDSLIGLMDPKDYDTFVQGYREAKQAMLETLAQGAGKIEGQDSELATTLESMAKSV